MKILAIGDFHGKFPVKLRRLAKEVDLVVSVGDYPDWGFRKIFFKHCYNTGMQLWDIIGKKKYKDGTLRDWKNGESILKNLNSLGIPVITTIGNYDDQKLHDAFDVKKGGDSASWLWDEDNSFAKIINKFPKIKRIDYKSVRIGGLVFIGGLGHSFPGKVKSKSYKRHRAKMEKLFKRYSKENREGRVVFLVHNMPYDCKLDKIRDKNAPMIAQGRHYGSKLIRRIIDKFQPVLCVGGHFHENQGKVKIGKTLVVNSGATYEGKCAIIDFNEGKGKVKSVRFVK